MLVVTIATDSDFSVLIVAFIIQSLIIGFFNFLLMLKVGKYVLKGASPVTLAYIFAVHYGTINLVALFFAIKQLNEIKPLFFVVPLIVFIFPHYLSYKEKLKLNYANYNVKDINDFLFRSYFRILPTYIITGIATMFNYSIFLFVIFVILKTVADFKMHRIERKLLLNPRFNSHS